MTRNLTANELAAINFTRTCVQAFRSNMEDAHASMPTKANKERLEFLLTCLKFSEPDYAAMEADAKGIMP